MNHRMQGLGCWMWVMIGLWLGIAPITEVFKVVVASMVNAKPLV
jgi:hypothetical protein